MDNNVSKVLDVWQELSNKIPEYNPYELTHNWQQFAALFTPGSFYFYIMNFKKFQIQYVHSGTRDVLKLEPEEFTMEKLLSMVIPEDLEGISKKEAIISDFLFEFLTPDQIPHYKMVYHFRVRDTKGRIHSMLHQASTLTVSESGRVENALGVHTDISHLGKNINKNVSFISLNGGDSYYNVDPEKKKFDPLNYSSSDVGLINAFSKREIEIIKLLATGLNADEMAENLFISKHTINTHKKNILKRSGCTNTTELIAKSIINGLI